MKLPEQPLNEEARISELLSLNILDTEADAELDSITELASAVCGTPIALISLIDTDRQWFKSRVGLTATETPRDYAFCAHAINHPDEVFLVKDSTKDERFFDNPLVTGEPHVIFYCGVPIVMESGHAIGTVCAIDNHPRDLNEFQINSLKKLAKMAARSIQSKSEKSYLMDQLTAMNRTMDNAGAFYLRVGTDGCLLHFGDQWPKIIPGFQEGLKFDEVFEIEGYDAFATLASGLQTRKFIHFHDKEKRSFKASVLILSGSYVLMALPDIPLNQTLKDYNLKETDFPEYKELSDFLFLSEIGKKDLQESERLNLRISRQNSELKKALLSIEKLSSFPDQNPNPVLRVGRDLEILYYNDSASKLLDLFGIKEYFTDFDHLSDLVSLLFSGFRQSFQEEVVSYKGRTFVFSLVYYAEHDFVNIYGFEISNYANKILLQGNELVELNAKLLSQETFLQNIFDILPADVVLFDNEMRFRFINKSAVKDDQRRQWMIGKTEKEYAEMRGIPLEKAEKRETYFRKMMQTGKPVDWIEEAVNAEGQIRYYLRTLNPPTSLERSEQHYIAYGLDITDQVVSKKKLEELNANLEKIIDEQTRENLELNATISETEKLVAIGELTMGIAHDLNSPIASIRVGAESIRDTLEELFHGLIHDCTRDELEFACVNAMESSSIPFMSGIKVVKERRQIEQYLLGEKKCTNETASLLAHGLVKAKIEHHERVKIDKVLSSTHPETFLNLMKSIHTVRQMVDTIFHSANRSADVVSDLRKFTRSAIHQGAEKVNVNESITNVLRVLSSNLKGNIDIHMELVEDCFVQAIPRDVFQIWSNVLKNAFEAIGDDQGDIWIRTLIKDGRTIVQFENNGPEIPPQMLPEIFDRFRSSKGSENSGFGLNIVKRILEKNKWEVDIHSSKDSTIFEFQL